MSTIDPTKSEQNPYILTLKMDDTATTFFNEQRQLHFPARVNYLQAHLTLFHFLPLPADKILQQLQQIVENIQIFTIEVVDVVSLGKGVAYKLESKELQVLHSRLQQLWKPLLKPQDLQKLWPHITVQNKVTPQQAKDLLITLKADFEPFSFKATGLALWEYLGGPWRYIDAVNFS